MDYKKFIEQKIDEIKKIVKEEKAICATSGGVDSSVVTVLGHKALGDKLKVIFIDDGLMRENEPEEVVNTFKKLGIKVNVIKRANRFFLALKSIEDPEQKRKIFRDTFYKVLEEEIKKSGAKFLLQGTIAADIIETKKGVKTQHNILQQIGINPEKGYGFSVIEPIKELFKDQVREVAKLLGLPKKIYQRMPFPGPGLATRIVGEVTPQRVAIVRKAVKIVEEEVKNTKPFQAFAVLLKDKATGITPNGTRKFGEIIAIRCVDSTDAMKAEPTKLDWKILTKIRERIIKEIPSVIKVVYDITPKPPSTIEYI